MATRTVATKTAASAEKVYVTPTKMDGSPADTAKAPAAAGTGAISVEDSATGLRASATSA